jgi:NADH-quinone oxidoreductase subunit M
MRQLTIISAFGIVLGAAYLLYTIQRVYLGKPKPEYANFPDLKPVEYLALVPLAVISIILGVWPNLVLNLFTGAMGTMLTLWNSGAAKVAAAAITHGGAL